jgi:Zn-finger nucleic acid-binding protein
MVVFELDGVEIDRCLRCGGTWLDDGELDHLARVGGVATDPLEKALSGADAGKKGQRRCARCSAKMRVVTLEKIEIDRCPRGHGLWFDRNEMETLIATFQGGDGGAMARLLGELHPGKQRKGG